MLLNVTSAFTEPHNRPLLLLLASFHTTTTTTASTKQPLIHSNPTCVCERSTQRRVLAPQLLPHPEETRGSHFTISPNTGAQCQETQSKRDFRGLRPLKTLHCLQKASPHRGRSICNTVRGVAHYCPAPVPLCLFCAADRRIQLPGRANKRECSYIKNKGRMRKRINLQECVIGRRTNM